MVCNGFWFKDAHNWMEIGFVFISKSHSLQHADFQNITTKYSLQHFIQISMRAYIRMGIYSEKKCSIAKLHIQSHFIKLNLLTSSKLAFINFSLYFAFQSSLKCVSMVVRWIIIIEANVRRKSLVNDFIKSKSNHD